MRQKYQTKVKKKFGQKSIERPLTGQFRQQNQTKIRTKKK